MEKNQNWKDVFVERFNQEYENWVKNSNNGKHSQNAFSKYLGLTNKSVVQRYLSNNTQSVQMDDLILISNKLNVSIDYLCGLSSVRRMTPTQDDKAISKASELTGLSLDSLNILHQRNEMKKIYEKYDTRLGGDSYLAIPKDIDFLNDIEIYTLSKLICSSKFHSLMRNISDYMFFTEDRYKNNSFELASIEMNEDGYHETPSNIKLSFGSVNDVLGNQIIKVLDGEKKTYSKEKVFNNKELNQYIKDYEKEINDELESMNWESSTFDEEDGE